VAQAATALYVVGILALFALGRERGVRTSPAIWLPVVWLMIGGSRNVSEWLQMSGPTGSDRYLEGNPLDRNILTTILALGVIALIGRRREVASFVKANPAVFLFFAYCGVSVFWSDYPGVALKRWFRALGDMVMILIVLTDPQWLTAIKRFLARAGYVLLPVSVLLIRYYPDLGRGYSRWTGKMSWTGVATDKNALGMICLILGLAAAWRFVLARRRPKGGERTRLLIAEAAVVAMAVWLLLKADSATAIACFALAGALMTLASWSSIARKPVVLHLLVAGVLSLALGALFLESSGLLAYVGRDATLTGRTDIWPIVLGMTTNRVVGSGFESFWLGDRLDKMLGIYASINQAHNGYLEIFLNLGWVGIGLLALVMLTGYGRIVAAVRQHEETGSLRLAFFVTAVIYNVTEGGFKMMHPVWITFLLAVTAVPGLSVPQVRNQPADGFVPRPPVPLRPYRYPPPDTTSVRNRRVGGAGRGNQQR
jgi:exopolysaccharide production protein ExoQ